MCFTAPPLVAPHHPYRLPPHNTVRSLPLIWRPPLLSLPLLKYPYSATGHAPPRHKSPHRRYTPTLLILQHTVRIQRHQSTAQRCVGRLLISNAVPLKRCDPQFLDGAPQALSSITQNSKVQLPQDPLLSPSFPAHLSTATPLTFHAHSLPPPLASLLETLTTLQHHRCSPHRVFTVQTQC